MLTTAETTAVSASASASRTLRECDYCGRTVHRAIAIERIERAAGKRVVVTLCAQCALDD